MPHTKKSPAKPKSKRTQPTTGKGKEWKAKLAKFRKMTARVRKARLTDPTSIVGPSVVPGLSAYWFYFDTSGFPDPATSVLWAVDSDNAVIVGADDESEVQVSFANTADYITLSVSIITIDGTMYFELQISIVEIDILSQTFARPGTVDGYTSGTDCYIAIPPACPTAEHWVTWCEDGSDYAAYTYNGTCGAFEDCYGIKSNSGGTESAFTVTTELFLIAPDGHADALNSIDVGYIQHAALSGEAVYEFGATREYVVPSDDSLDWIKSTSGPVPFLEEWPWYGSLSMVTASPDDGTRFCHIPDLNNFGDSPGATFPKYYRVDEPFGIAGGAIEYDFTIYIAACTHDEPGIFYTVAYAFWDTVFPWPPGTGHSLVTIPSGWTIPASPTSIDVNSVPSIINASGTPNAFRRMPASS